MIVTVELSFMSLVLAGDLARDLDRVGEGHIDVAGPDISGGIFYMEYVRVEYRGLPTGPFHPGAPGPAADASVRARRDDARPPPGRIRPAQLRFALSHGRRAGAKRLDRPDRTREGGATARAYGLQAHR